MIQTPFSNDQTWVYNLKNKYHFIFLSANSCLTLNDLVDDLERESNFTIGNSKKRTTKANGLAKVIKGERKQYAGWSYKESAA